MTKWMAFIHSNSEADATNNLNELLTNLHPGMIDYLQNTWLKYKEHFVDANVNRYQHLGFNSTSAIEKMNHMIKLYSNLKSSSFFDFYRHFEALIDNQTENINDAIMESSSKTKLKIYNVPMFNDLYGIVAPIALEIAFTELMKAKGNVCPTSENFLNVPNATLPPCTEYHRTCLGIPCAHEFQTLLCSNIQPQYYHFNQHWLLSEKLPEKTNNRHISKRIKKMQAKKSKAPQNNVRALQILLSKYSVFKFYLSIEFNRREHYQKIKNQRPW